MTFQDYLRCCDEFYESVNEINNSFFDFDSAEQHYLDLHNYVSENYYILPFDTNLYLTEAQTTIIPTGASLEPTRKITKKVNFFQKIWNAIINFFNNIFKWVSNIFKKASLKKIIKNNKELEKFGARAKITYELIKLISDKDFKYLKKSSEFQSAAPEFQSHIIDQLNNCRSEVEKVYKSTIKASVKYLSHEKVDTKDEWFGSSSTIKTQTVGQKIGSEDKINFIDLENIVLDHMKYLAKKIKDDTDYVFNAVLYAFNFINIISTFLRIFYAFIDFSDKTGCGGKIFNHPKAEDFVDKENQLIFALNGIIAHHFFDANKEKYNILDHTPGNAHDATAYGNIADTPIIQKIDECKNPRFIYCISKFISDHKSNFENSQKLFSTYISNDVIESMKKYTTLSGSLEKAKDDIRMHIAELRQDNRIKNAINTYFTDYNQIMNLSFQFIDDNKSLKDLSINNKAAQNSSSQPFVDKLIKEYTNIFKNLNKYIRIFNQIVINRDIDNGLYQIYDFCAKYIKTNKQIDEFLSKQKDIANKTISNDWEYDQNLKKVNNKNNLTQTDKAIDEMYYKTKHKNLEDDLTAKNNEIIDNYNKRHKGL